MRIHSQIADIPSARVASSSGSSSLVSAGTVVCALLPVLLLIGIFSLCVKGCHKKRDSSRGSDEAELDQGDAGNTTETDMNNEANGRPVSHDRALPEIPPVPSGVTSTDDDDEEDEGHYDIISKGKKVSARDQLSASAAVAQSSSASGSASKKKNRSHPYEKVRGDPDSDSVYAGIKDELDPAKLPPTGRVGGVMDGVTLHGGLRYSEARSGLSTEASSNAGSIHSNLYATVGTGQRSHSNGFSDDAFRRSSQGLSLPIAASGDSALGTGLSPTALVPPVPQKMFDPAEEGGGGVSNGRGVPNQLDSSPSLPPRNGDSSNGAVANGSNRMSDGSGRMSGLGIGPGGPLVPSIGPWTAMSAFPSLIINIGDAGSMTSEAGSSQPQTTAKRVPDYSSVTARESLESLRKRQQQQQASQMQVMQFADIDGTYDTINYDQVKMPATPGRLSTNILTTENVYNNGSDLYAEIGTETNSARSSTYAKVGDLTLPVSSHVSDGIPFPPPPPPSPPPVNTLQQLTHSNLDDQTDPGYSRVDVQRPRSVNSVSTSAVHTSSVPFQHTATGRRSPVYAVVNKSKQSNRQTIHVDENVERGVRQNNSDMNSLANLYAKVSKPKDHRRTSSSGASFVVNDTPSLTSLAFGGARPKVRGQVVGTGHMGEVTRSDHGYASIDNVVNDINKAEDPDYDVVGDGNSLDGLPEYDPNYETVAVSHVPPSGITLRSTVHCGVAHEIMPNGIAHQPRRHMNHIHSASPIWHLPRREHIYEVVKDSSEERDRGERDRGAYNHDSSHATDL